MTANNELGHLTIDDPNKLCAIELPNFGQMQWRWRLRLPAGNRYRLRWMLDDIPESNLPDAPPVNKLELLDAAARPVAKGDPFILTLAIHKNDAGKWVLNFVLPERSTAININDIPAWIEGDRIGWGARVAGRNMTEAVERPGPLVLLRYRKGKQVPPNAWTVDMEPTDGVIVWIEEIAR